MRLYDEDKQLNGGFENRIFDRILNFEAACRRFFQRMFSKL